MPPISTPLLPLLLLPAALSFGTASQKSCVVKICHNKDCTKKGGGETLRTVFRDLIPPTTSKTDHIQLNIESSGCLSQCGKGPNVCVVNNNGNEDKICTSSSWVVWGMVSKILMKHTKTIQGRILSIFLL